jgi:hypothetical protein
LARINDQISAKVEDFFELSEYDWTPQGPEAAPSMYLYELVNWLTTVVDSLVIKEKYKDTAYTGAASYIADCLMVSLTCSCGLCGCTADGHTGFLDGAGYTHDE